MKRQFVYYLLMLLFVAAFVFAWLTKDAYAIKNSPQNKVAVTTPQD